ncbi:MAG: repressor LexA [Rickettsiales bacterium]|nr:repressor LexA [Rickettsiales bacterium]OUV80697.1 MAG: repressor LexA [Rickettsiales bacterium TMED131]
MLTVKQAKLLDYLKEALTNNKVSPSFDEMRMYLGLQSKSGVHRLISSLEERGFIKRLHNKARAIKILEEEDSMNTNYKTPSIVNNKNNCKVYIYGKISAGTPVEAIQHSEGNLDVPADMIKNSNQHYALKVSGDSMIDAGILNGDIAVLEKTTEVVNGDIVVALIDGQEATLKRLRRKTNSIALEPANKKFETRIFGLGRVIIQGKLVGIIRNY